MSDRNGKCYSNFDLDLCRKARRNRSTFHFTLSAERRMGFLFSRHCFDAGEVRRITSARERDMSPRRGAEPSNNTAMGGVKTFTGSHDRHTRLLPKGVQNDRHSPKQASSKRIIRRSGPHTNTPVYTVGESYPVERRFFQCMGEVSFPAAVPDYR